MATELLDIPTLSMGEAISETVVEAQKATPSLSERFDNEWYVRVKTEFRSASLPQVKGQIVLEMEGKVAELHEGLKNQLSSYDIQLFPQRFIHSADSSSEKLYTCYWLIGLPLVPSAELSASRKLLKVWQDEAGKPQPQGVKKTVQSKFVPRKAILEQNLSEDLSKLLVTQPSTEPKENRQTGETFKKRVGSNPAQVRKQFLQHGLGRDPESAYPQKPMGKLRPPKDVLNRLNFDAGYDLEEYVVGYIDRKAGILEKPVGEWQELEEMELIAYFKHLPENLVVWDRARKIDWIFNQRPDTT